MENTKKQEVILHSNGSHENQNLNNASSNTQEMYCAFIVCPAGCKCPKDPCANATCPGVVGATCEADFGNCSATWVIDGEDVTDQCQGQF